MPIPRFRPSAAPALLTGGFRPFFFFGAIAAAILAPIWLMAYFGYLWLDTAFAPAVWHAHEMLFGALAAIVAGFLLTAVPNWTGRLPLQGWPLAGLVALWGLGRLAILMGPTLGVVASAFIDVSFLIALALVVAREIIAGGSARNLVVLVLLCLLIAANIGFHLEAATTGAAPIAERAGVSIIVTMIALVGGRIIPSFTRNWLARLNPGRLPATPDRFDRAVALGGGLALAGWTFAPDAPWTGYALLLFALGHGVRLVRWVGWRAARDPLVLILHLAYAFMPIGFALSAGAALGYAPASAGLHAFAAGAFGCMTLAVMTRASLGHSGRALHAGAATRVIYILAALGALARIAAAFWPSAAIPLLGAAAFGWTGAFGLFAVAYAPIFWRPKARATGRQG